MVRIKFQYTEMPVVIAAFPMEVKRKVTFCKVDNDGVLSSAYTVYRPDDSYDKYIGRKIALGRAIKHYPKNVRAKIWDIYKSKHKV